MPSDRCIELVLNTDDRPAPRTCPVKRLSEGELAKPRRQLIDLLDCGWLQPSTTGHARRCRVRCLCPEVGRTVADLLRLSRPEYHHRAPRRTRATHRRAARRDSRRSVVHEIRPCHHQIRIREADWWKTSVRSPFWQFEWKVMPLALQGVLLSLCSGHEFHHEPRPSFVGA
jgi:hypothetical protein